MDASPLFDPTYLPVILGTLVGFGVLAALLLVPISRFLDREQEVSEKWTPEELAKHLNEKETPPTDAEVPDETETAAE